MSTITPPPRVDGPDPDATPTPPPDTAPGVDAATAPTEPTAARVSPQAIALAGALAGGAAGWVTAGLFAGGLARIVALVAAALGGAVIAFAGDRRSPVHWLLLPAGLVLGVVLALPDAGGGSANVVSQVAEALRSGGLSQPPVPFDPGWRVLLSVIVTMLAGSAGAMAISARRPSLAVLLPAPFALGAALAQPAGSETLSIAVGVVLLLAGFVVVTAAEEAAEGAVGGGFHLRRFSGSIGALAATGVGVVVIANAASFLLPAPRADQVIPPQRPQAVEPLSDRELFTVTAPRQVPWRLGVLDVYEDGAWKLPPFDPARFVPLDETSELTSTDTPADRETFTVTITLGDLPGRQAPVASEAVTTGLDVAAGFDPRTQSIRLDELARAGTTYTVTAYAPADVATLQAAGPPPAELAPFLDVPPPPDAVRTLLASLPPDVSTWDRLQLARQAYYADLVAAGAGDPVDVPVQRVEEILTGDQASPYEITAVEALLARWVGVPARIGYGWFGGEVLEGETRSVRPRHGAAWLEVWFEPTGWMPIVGRPPRAQAGFNDAEKNADATVQPTDELALITFVPVRLSTRQLLVDTIRYWTVRGVAVVALVVGVIAFAPVPRRMLRRQRRRRWARRHGPAGRLVVAYAEFRDALEDLGIGHQALTPLELVREVADDAEHRELAWLVTRGLWGDLARDLTDTDAVAAEALTSSVLTRIRRAQPGSSRTAAAASRASLKNPWSDDLPGGRRRPTTEPRAPRPRRWTMRRPRLPRRLARLLASALSAMLLSGCVQSLELGDPADAVALPEPVAPNTIGDLRLRRERSAETPFTDAGETGLVAEGRVFSVRRPDGTVEASLQIAWLRPGGVVRVAEGRAGILDALGGGRFQPIRIGDDRFLVAESTEQRLLLWFAGDGTRYHLMAARSSFEEADLVMAYVLRAQRGDDLPDSLDELEGRIIDDFQRGLPT